MKISSLMVCLSVQKHKGTPAAQPMKEQAIMSAKKIVLFWVYAVYPGIFLEITKNPSLAAGEQRQNQGTYYTEHQDVKWQCTYKEAKANFIKRTQAGQAGPNAYYNFFQIARYRGMYNDAFLVAAIACLHDQTSPSLYESWKEMIREKPDRGFTKSDTAKAFETIYAKEYLIGEATKMLIRDEMMRIVKYPAPMAEDSSSLNRHPSQNCTEEIKSSGT